MSTDYPNDHEPQNSEVNFNEDGIFTESDTKEFAENSFNEENVNDENKMTSSHDSEAHHLESYEANDQHSNQVEIITPADFAEDQDLIENETSELETQQEPEFATVNISILSKDYTINCPVGEEYELFEASDFINNFIEDLRSQAPHLPHENLLVLCCLNLYEKLQQSKNAAAEVEKGMDQANQLIARMIEDMQLVQQ
ncbi:cell division protein ZapA [Psychrobacter sanguinis]|uniref:cell division protein ZapA n=1 Tax=Psychrobacter sanguinis TaxID=861445 RepID=UPI00020C7F01|nr:cell division protein ZapA [Psychrobacter sanguinis]EGK09476.1 cell division protein ZapA [Psychrobacter sp. 1501(2011)]MCC3307058.1 cell division protein ZapA [Psychrobacter sanguinis]MCC3345164.1 cell division protein ZapA [Psychrobacter sanguinis]MCD9152347.1 cell division protein ZapA [Psychrobacter sanguinis]UEC24431.1 cell division protein ZapA [Psychrobacter sanguinis]